MSTEHVPMIDRILRAFIAREWPALVFSALIIASASGWLTYHWGVQDGIAEAAYLREENAVVRSVCYRTLATAERARDETLSAQETLRELREKRRASVEDAGWEVDW